MCHKIQKYYTNNTNITNIKLQFNCYIKSPIWIEFFVSKNKINFRHINEIENFQLAYVTWNVKLRILGIYNSSYVLKY